MWAAAEGHADVVKALLDASADPNRKARVTTLAERKHADHPTGGFTALMYRGAQRARGGARGRSSQAGRRSEADQRRRRHGARSSPSSTTASTWPERCSTSAPTPTTARSTSPSTCTMRRPTCGRATARGCAPTIDNTMTALDLIKLLLDRGADPNKAFIGQLHSSTLCCGAEINASPFYRAAVAADVEALKLMIAQGRAGRVEPGRGEEGPEPMRGGGGRGNANVGRTPMMVAINGGRGAAFAAGPGFERLGPPPFREASNREPVEAVKVLLAAGANPNVKAPDGSTPLHQAVTARQVPIIRALVAAGAKLDAVNKDNLTPLLLAEKPEPPPPPGNNTDSRAFRPKRNTREEVIAALRELMGLGPERSGAGAAAAARTTEKKNDEKKTSVTRGCAVTRQDRMTDC